MADPVDDAAAEAAIYDDCPHAEVCKWCTCADEDDVCFPGERLRAELTEARASLERLNETFATTTRVAAEEMRQLRAERDEARASLERVKADRDQWWAIAQAVDPHPDSRALITLGDRIEALKVERDEAVARAEETKRDLRTPVGDGLAVKPLGHIPPGSLERMSAARLQQWHEAQGWKARAEKAERLATRLQNRVLELSRAEADRQEEERPPHA